MEKASFLLQLDPTTCRGLVSTLLRRYPTDIDGAFIIATQGIRLMQVVEVCLELIRPLIATP